MVTLSDTLTHHSLGQGDSIIAKAFLPGSPPRQGDRALLAATQDDLAHVAGHSAILALNHETFEAAKQLGVATVLISEKLSHVEEGDILRIFRNTGSTRILIKKKHRQNPFLLTERCNNYCVMCSQPPRDIDDSYLIEEALRTISLLDQDTPEIGFTGGEPTLLGDGLIRLFNRAKNMVPNASVHCLSNGRQFKDAEFTRKVAEAGHPDLMFGVPLYADNAADHDYVVQAEGAFNETVKGLLNLRRFGIRIEIRCVLHSATVDRLPELARYIAKNLIFVDHIAFMGLEAMGFGKSNFTTLWVDPNKYAAKLEEAISILRNAGCMTKVYNLPLCVLGTESRACAVRSISDWKNEYLAACDTCSAKSSCCGFFASTKHHYENLVRPIA